MLTISDTPKAILHGEKPLKTLPLMYMVVLDLEFGTTGAGMAGVGTVGVGIAGITGAGDGITGLGILGAGTTGLGAGILGDMQGITTHIGDLLITETTHTTEGEEHMLTEH